MSADLDTIASALLAASDAKQTADLPSATNELDADDGYAIQDTLIAKRLERGEVVVGAKLGLTSLAKQQAMHVHEPIFGVLTDAMALKEGEPAPLSELIHPRVEPEIVFVLNEELKGPGATREQVLSSASVHIGLEIIDSRYADFSFTHADVVADNTSAARFVVSEKPLPDGVDLINVHVSIARDGSVEDEATGAAVMGDPAAAVALLANWLAARGRSLPAGSIVLSGGMTNAYALGAGSTITAVFDGEHSISVSAG